MSDFLENLKKAADEGEFNSEAAKKILEINELADKKIGEATPADLERIQESLEKRQGEELVAPVSEEKVLEANTEYEKKMAQLKKLDAVNAQLAILIEIEDMVKLSIEDMFGFTDELEAKFEKEFETEDPMFGDLSQKIEELKSKYKSIIN
jgi:hypothetical protein